MKTKTITVTTKGKSLLELYTVEKETIEQAIEVVESLKKRDMFGVIYKDNEETKEFCEVIISALKTLLH